MDSVDFYKNLPLLQAFGEVAQSSNYHSAPEDWIVVMTDVVSSTEAVNQGLYKNVNIVGASAIIGLMNVAPNVEFPFVFGGDGTTCLIPPSMRRGAETVLQVARSRAEAGFQLKLRVGLIPVRRILKKGFSIRVGKLKVSEYFHQAVFTGGGMVFAEELLKNPTDTENYELSDRGGIDQADFSGLECRWNPVPGEKGEILSLLVQAVHESVEEQERTYREVIRHLNQLYGAKENYHPISFQSMSLASRRKDFVAEHRTRRGVWHPFLENLHLVWMQLENVIARIGFRKRLKTGFFDFDRYQDALVQNIDFQKFDDMIRMVLSSSTEERCKLETILNELREQGKIVYGVHVTDKALLTCLVFDRQNHHFHFIDGADGGYASAAKMLKSQRKPVDL